MICDCGHEPGPITGCGTGYGQDDKGKTKCYTCCAEEDKAYMREHGRITLYLAGTQAETELTNWPGSFRIPIRRIVKGSHNWARTRYDTWFTFEGATWHGVQYGENTQLCHCKRIKS